MPKSQNRKKPTGITAVYMFSWIEHEFEPGWGASQRRDGYSYSSTQEKALNYKTKREQSGVYELYDRTTESQPRLVEVDIKFFNEVHKNGTVVSREQKHK